MGLDQWLDRTVRLSSARDPILKDIPAFSRYEEIFDCIEGHGIVLPDTSVSPDYLSADLKLRVGTWRKANAIHKWFIDHCDGAEDTNADSPLLVTKDNMAALADDCMKVLNDNDLAIEVLPPLSGFFFGSTEIDEWYLEDLKYTLLVCEYVAKHCADDDQLTYTAWW